MGGDKAGVEAERLTVRGFRLSESFYLLQDIAKIEVNFRALRLKHNHLLQASHGFFAGSGLAVDYTLVKPCFRIERIKLADPGI